jgi:hypothetical protein
MRSRNSQWAAAGAVGGNPFATGAAGDLRRQQTSATVEVTHQGGVTASGDLSIDLPFMVDVTHLELGRAESRSVVVSFVPTAAGPFTATLKVGPLETPLEAQGKAVPPCEIENVCQESQFDCLGAALERTPPPCNSSGVPNPPRNMSLRAPRAGEGATTSSEPEGSATRNRRCHERRRGRSSAGDFNKKH